MVIVVSHHNRLEGRPLRPVLLVVVLAWGRLPVFRGDPKKKKQERKWFFKLLPLP